MNPDPHSDLPPWSLVAEGPIQDLIIFRARHEVWLHPRNRTNERRLVLETPSWCNIVALTPERHLVVVRQFRFGSRSFTTEIPGGCVDAGEEPLAAARRELREETGYTSEQWTELGVVEPNPAFHDNLCWHFLAEGVRRTHEVDFDDGEDLVHELIPLDEAARRIRSGEIRHSLVISALCRVLDLRGG